MVHCREGRALHRAYPTPKTGDLVNASPPPAPPTWLDLYDWRSRVAALYRERDAAERRGEDPAAVLARFRSAKHTLFATHPQSPLDPVARATFDGLRYFDYNPDLCVRATLAPVTADAPVEAPSSGPRPMALRPAATIECSVVGQQVLLTVYWIDVYGGGLFLPFRDATCPAESYGAGRYLFDTVKGSDLVRLESPDPDRAGYAGGAVLVDFNFAYNPSCAYDPRWVCPLAPHENWLTVPIRAGERRYDP
jgi:uncharacterized protein (DUF1684 family)